MEPKQFITQVLASLMLSVLCNLTALELDLIFTDKERHIHQ